VRHCERAHGVRLSLKGASAPSHVQARGPREARALLLLFRWSHSSSSTSRSIALSRDIVARTPSWLLSCTRHGSSHSCFLRPM
jgi:hypothetical protein